LAVLGRDDWLFLGVPLIIATAMTGWESRHQDTGEEPSP
jgi:hypothetical protein